MRASYHPAAASVLLSLGGIACGATLAHPDTRTSAASASGSRSSLPRSSASLPASRAPSGSSVPMASNEEQSKNTQKAALATGESVESNQAKSAVVGVFPPPPFKPPFDRTAKPSDGVWEPMPIAGQVQGRPVMFRTTVHPRKFQRLTEVVIVAVDSSLVGLVLVPGTREPKADNVPTERRTGLVAREDLDRLVAVFNGGFQTKHGHYGMKVGNDVFGQPRSDACTVAITKSEKVTIGTWASVASRQGDWISYRQTPPCLAEGGVLNPALRSEWKRRRWGGAVDGKKEVRRTAIGVDDTGRTLFFGIGEELRADDLAKAMVTAGASDVAQLDINWSYTRFLFFGHPKPDAPLQVVETLIPKLKHTKRGYVSKPSPRDFFYLRQR